MKAIIDTSFDHLFNMFHKDTKCSLHSLDPLFYCTNDNCSDDYICSKCLNEKEDHYSQHSNMLIPIDTQEKFLKHLNIALISEVNENCDAPIPTKESIEQFYDLLKKQVIDAIDEHKKSNIDKLLIVMNPKHNKVTNEEVLKSIDGKINKFTAKKDIIQFAKEINEDLKKINYYYKQSTNSLDEHFTRKVNELINDNVFNYFGLKSKENSDGNTINNSQLEQMKGEFNVLSSSSEYQPNESIKNRLQLLKDKMNQIKK